MKTYIAIVLTLILVSLLGIGFILYRSSGYNFNLTTRANQKPTNSDETYTTKEENDNAAVFQEDVKGSVKGKVCYPSESIPPLTLYFQEKDSLNIIQHQTKANQSEYEFEDLPIGTYTAYAYVTGVESDGGGYTKAVTCGLTTDCDDHSLIEFNILEGETTMDIDICDWYGAEIPERPE
jgi:hypothetical protein